MSKYLDLKHFANSYDYLLFVYFGPGKTILVEKLQNFVAHLDNGSTFNFD